MPSVAPFPAHCREADGRLFGCSHSCPRISLPADSAISSPSRHASEAPGSCLLRRKGIGCKLDSLSSLCRMHRRHGCVQLTWEHLLLSSDGAALIRTRPPKERDQTSPETHTTTVLFCHMSQQIFFLQISFIRFSH